ARDVAGRAGVRLRVCARGERPAPLRGAAGERGEPAVRHLRLERPDRSREPGARGAAAPALRRGARGRVPVGGEAARHGAPVALAADALAGVAASRRVVEAAIARGETIYGVTTGFGKLAHVRIPAEQARELQRNLIRSHASGVGDPLSEEAVRAMMLLRANVLV